MIKRLDASNLAIRNQADTTFYHWQVGQEIIHNFLQFTHATPLFYTNNDLLFKTLDGAAAWQAVMQIIHGADYRVDIPRCGDVTLLPGKTLDLVTNPAYCILPGAGTLTQNACYYNPAADELRIYDGVNWKVH